MGNAARKARKKAGEQFTKPAKSPTSPYVDAKTAQLRRRREREAQELAWQMLPEAVTRMTAAWQAKS